VKSDAMMAGSKSLRAVLRLFLFVLFHYVLTNAWLKHRDYLRVIEAL